MPIPASFPTESHIKQPLIRRHHLREPGSADGAKGDPFPGECAIHRIAPPAAMAKLYDVAMRWVELRHNTLQAGRGKAATGRKLKKEAAHFLPEGGRDFVIRFHQLLRAHHALL